MNRSEFNDAFVKANANREFIAHEMADVLRDLMRAISSEDDTGYKAAERMNFVGELLQHCDEKLGWWHIFSDAIEIIRANEPQNSFEADYLHIAKRGIKYFVESSATDNAARGRAAARRRDLEQAIKWQEESRITSSANEIARLKLQQNAQKLIGKSK